MIPEDILEFLFNVFISILFIKGILTISLMYTDAKVRVLLILQRNTP